MVERGLVCSMWLVGRWRMLVEVHFLLFWIWYCACVGILGRLGYVCWWGLVFEVMR